MMDRYELLRRVGNLPLVADTLANDLLSGGYRSVFRGQGIEFDEVRHYQQGDDARAIDWNVSARFGTPYIKLYREERELQVAIVLDDSESMFSGEEADWKPDVPRGGNVPCEGDEGGLSRHDQAVLAAALIALSAEKGGQRVSAVLFDSKIRRVFPPRKGREHILALLSAALSPPAPREGSCLGRALITASRLLKRRGLIIILSDFQALGWELPLGDLARRHDVIAIRLCSPIEEELPPLGLLSFIDPETRARTYAPSRITSFRDAWKEWHSERRELFESICRRAGAARFSLSTSQDAAAVLLRFFKGRRRRGNA